METTKARADGTTTAKSDTNAKTTPTTRNNLRRDMVARYTNPTRSASACLEKSYATNTKKAAAKGRRFLFLFSLRRVKLLLNERQEAHEASALDCGFDGALLLGCELTLGAAHDATVRIDELLEQVHVLVVYVLNVILCENVHMVFC